MIGYFTSFPYTEPGQLADFVAFLDAWSLQEARRWN